jgi:hypothetical protein
MPVAATISPVQSDVQAALYAFLTDVTGLPNGQIIAADPNRVPEPSAPTFIIMSSLRFERVDTNRDATGDVRFTGSIAAGAPAVLTVSAVSFGSITPGMPVLGPGVAPLTLVVAQLSGTPGGVGTYSVNISQTIASEVMSGGTTIVTTSYIETMQIDFHSADYSASALAQTVATLFRDTYAVNFFANLPSPQNNVTPLYCEDAIRIPFINDQNQYERRWTLDVKLQVDQTVSVPQTYDDSVVVSPYFVP